jgi:hypothetical protein
MLQLTILSGYIPVHLAGVIDYIKIARLKTDSNIELDSELTVKVGVAVYFEPHVGQNDVIELESFEEIGGGLSASYALRVSVGTEGRLGSASDIEAVHLLKKIWPKFVEKVANDFNIHTEGRIQLKQLVNRLWGLP